MNTLLYPRSKEHAPLEYGWEGYSEVIVFSTDDEISKLALWYRNLGYEVIDDSIASTSVQLQLREKGHSENVAEVLAVATQEEESVLDLTSYIGSRSLETFAEAMPTTIGTLFIRRQSA